MSTTRTAVVTGAARGIGRAIAHRLATDGHHVAVLDLDESACQAVVDEITEGGGTAVAVGVDVARFLQEFMRRLTGLASETPVV